MTIRLTPVRHLMMMIDRNSEFMKIRNPVFLPFAVMLILSVAVANHFGWSAFAALAAQTWQRSGPATQHK